MRPNRRIGVRRAIAVRICALHLSGRYVAERPQPYLGRRRDDVVSGADEQGSVHERSWTSGAGGTFGIARVQYRVAMVVDGVNDARRRTWAS